MAIATIVAMHSIRELQLAVLKLARLTVMEVDVVVILVIVLPIILMSLVVGVKLLVVATMRVFVVVATRVIFLRLFEHPQTLVCLLTVDLFVWTTKQTIGLEEVPFSSVLFFEGDSLSAIDRASP